MSYENERKKFFKKPFWFVEIDVNGETYRFCENESPKPIGLKAIPSLDRVGVQPTEINYDGGMGVRARVTLNFKESKDFTVWGTRTQPERFWARWRAENEYYLGQPLRLYSGFITDGIYDPANFFMREYVLDDFSQKSDSVKIIAKDPLKLASSDRAQVPRESKGSLLGDIDEVATTLTLQPAGIGDQEYPSTDGIIIIGDEVITYAARNGDNITGMLRGQRGTEVDSHSQDDAVQVCQNYTQDTVSNMVYDWLVNFSPINPDYIDKDDWDAENEIAFGGNRYSLLLTEPTGVEDIINEFAESITFYVYWDERTNKIKLRGLKPPAENAPIFDYKKNFIKDSTSVRDMQKKRISTVIVNFGILNPAKDLDEPTNYRSTFVRSDVDSINNNNGQQVFKTINSRFITSDNKVAAVQVASRIGRRFAKMPRELQFELEAKDATIWTGDDIRCQSDLIIQKGGGYPVLNYQVISAVQKRDFKYKVLEHTYGDATPEDEDIENPNVDIVFINGEYDRLINQDNTSTGEPRSLRDFYNDRTGNAPINPDLEIKFIIEPSSIIGSSVNTEFALRTGQWSELNNQILIIVRGNILGKGGDSSGTQSKLNGGSAILLEDNVRMEVTGTIGAGGGAGGFTDIQTPPDASGQDYDATAGGGGGAGFFVGRGTKSGGGIGTVVDGENGTLFTGGKGGSAAGITGGDGGDLGQDGTKGSSGTFQQDAGIAGKAIELNGFTITFVTDSQGNEIRGTILGEVS